ncbi:hypothetical protein ON010_g1947 [Phytophthora cinnamomi]|nr:hypothetical protein ON010_g1947 [Phytophthora cinnamomi]
MYAAEFRWRAVVLHYAYGVPCKCVGHIFGISSRTVLRWYQQFKRDGEVIKAALWVEAKLRVLDTDAGSARPVDSS